MRKMMFGFPPWPVSGLPAGRKSNWAILQPGASVRPVMTKMACTSPLLVPSGLRLKRASRTGPFCVMNHGTTFFAPLRAAIAIKGFRGGLEPPGPGWEWQDRALVGIEAGAEAIVAASTHGLDFSKPGESILKERVFVRGEAGQWIAGTGGAAPVHRGRPELLAIEQACERKTLPKPRQRTFRALGIEFSVALS